MRIPDIDSEAELSRNIREFQIRLINRKYGHLAVRFAKLFFRNDLTREKLKLLEPFFIVLRGLERIVNSGIANWRA